MSNTPRAAVFLDRDGTIIEDRGDLRQPGDVRFLPETFAALRQLGQHFPLFLVTNQSGVGHGRLSLGEVESVNRQVAAVLRCEGIELGGIYVCPHAPQDRCRCAKPSPLLLRQAAAEHRLDLRRSYMVGDHPHDVRAGLAAGATGIYVLSGHGLRHRHELGDEPRLVVANIGEAAAAILDECQLAAAGEDALLQQAARLLRRGRLVAFPTETVYGLGGNAYDPAAVARIFAVKERPRFDPLIVHVPDASWLERLAQAVPELAWRLAEAFWPGPLTLVLPRRECIPELVVSGLSTVALRVPDHPLALALLRRVGLPLAAPSANRFGGVSPTCAAHVADGLATGVDLILDGGPCRVGVESTIIGFADGQPVLLRPGGVAVEQIAAVAGCQVLRPVARPGGDQAMPAPGMLERHYSPGKPVRLLAAGAAIPRPPADQPSALLLASRRPAAETAGYAWVECLSSQGDLAEMARHLFAALRRLDQSAAAVIVAETVAEHGLGLAINDRLRRAAAV